jgi:hypothetical protein
MNTKAGNLELKINMQDACQAKFGQSDWEATQIGNNIVFLS